MNREECCGTCKWHKPDWDFKGDWVCTNERSENIGDWTDFSDKCEDYEEKE